MNFTIIQCRQGDEEWDKLRAIRPTASEFDKIYTGSGKQSEQRSAYMSRLAIATKYQVPKFMGNKWTERGKDLEPQAREKFIEKTGFDVREVGFCQRKGSIAGCSPDGLIYHNGEPIAGLEIKCYKLDKHLAIVNAGKLPAKNKPQVHGGLWVTGLKAWIFCVYCPEAYPLDFRVIEVTPDSYTEKLGDAIRSFKTEYLATWAERLAAYEVDMVKRTTLSLMPTLCAAMDIEPEYNEEVAV